MNQIIKSIEIYRFRSFGRTTIEAKQLNIYSGKNNSGKSNILRALNLFFNSQTSYNTAYNHEVDYNKAFLEASGGKREIRIKINFLPTDGNGALQYPFSIEKSFQMGATSPIVKYDSTNDAVRDAIKADDGRITGQFTRFLNTLEYIYIPAIRDKKFIRDLLLKFELIVKSDIHSSELDDAVARLSSLFKEASKGISGDFKSYMGLPAEASLSSNISDLLANIDIMVDTGLQQRARKSSKNRNTIKNVPISLFSSGDGVVMAYLAYFLYYLTRKGNLARKKKKRFIWGFEEPENSLEYSKIEDLANEFLNTFSKQAQIFITTHSPAFINLRHQSNVASYRVYIRPKPTPKKGEDVPDRKITMVQSLEEIQKRLEPLSTTDQAYQILSDELHLAEQSNEIQSLLLKLREEEKALAKEKQEAKRSLNGIYPDDIFICEDKKAVSFWQSKLDELGLTKVRCVSSKGCSKLALEQTIQERKTLRPEYNPKIFREIDREGLSNEQIEYIAKHMPNKVTEAQYKIAFLPVYEIENFFILNNLEAYSNLPLDPNDRTIEDHFMNSTQARIGDYYSLFKGNETAEKIFPSRESARSELARKSRDKALKDPTRLMPGKEIIKARGLHKDPIGSLRNTPYKDLPSELQEYIQSIKEYFI